MFYLTFQKGFNLQFTFTVLPFVTILKSLCSKRQWSSQLDFTKYFQLSVFIQIREFLFLSTRNLYPQLSCAMLTPSNVTPNFIIYLILSFRSASYLVQANFQKHSWTSSISNFTFTFLIPNLWWNKKWFLILFIYDSMQILELLVILASVSSRLTRVESSRFCPTDSSRVESSRFLLPSRLVFSKFVKLCTSWFHVKWAWSHFLVLDD